jgi:hypothetical protein
MLACDIRNGYFGLALALALVTGCRGTKVEQRACMSVGGGGSLVSGAALFRLDVYGAGAACAGSSVAAGAGPPSESHTYTRNQPIVLDVSPGPHALVLTTFADAEATTPLGQGCVATTLTPGAQICFDLTLAPVTDLGLPPRGDLATSPPSDMSSPCKTIAASFTSAPQPPWMLENSAVYSSANRRVELNHTTDSMGGLFYTTPVMVSAFDATMQYYVQGPDGIALVLAAQSSGYAQNPTAGIGGGIGFAGMQGYAIELDDWQNAGEADGNHVAFVRASDGFEIVTANLPTQAIDCSCTRTMHVRFTGTHIHVDIDGRIALDADLPSTGATAFVPGGYYLGVTAASGAVVGATYLHAVDSLSVILGPPGVCF